MPSLKLAILLGLILTVVVGIQGKAADAQTWLSEVPAKDVKDTVIYQALSDFGGQSYAATLYGRDLEGVKKWKEGKELPLSVSSIKTIAQKAFQQQFAQFSQFKITSINLLHLTLIDDWVVQVEFSDTNAAASEDKRVNFLVLLNGRVITPTETAK
jgi:hypothetical protein